ncbi:MAG TPA: LptE family protein [Syntrophales bacterium]|jgi:outer membrane lipopolysaccharide assembly protein LptE/RlpB
MNTSLVRFIILTTMFLVLAACGYHFSPGGEYIDPDVRKVFIEPFANRTSQANLEDTIRLAITDWFVRGRRFQIVDNEAQADAIFRGTVKSLTTAPLSSRTTNLAAEERMTLTLELSFEDRRTKKVIWKDANFSGTQDYPVASLSDTETARKNALTKLSRDTAERAYRMMMSGF